MNELMNIFGQVTGTQSFDQIRISIASPERIHSWSYGEIKNPGAEQTVALGLEGPVIDRLRLFDLAV